MFAYNFLFSVRGKRLIIRKKENLRMGRYYSERRLTDGKAIREFLKEVEDGEVILGMKTVFEMKTLFERRIQMRKSLVLLVLVFVAAMCVPSYGSILVYKTSVTHTIFNITGDSWAKDTEKGYLVLDVNLATQTVSSAQQITYDDASQWALVAAVTFYNDVTDYIVADYSSGNTDAVLSGKTSTVTGIGTVAKTLKGYSLNLLYPNMGSGTFTATLDTAKTKANLTGSIATVVTSLLAGLPSKYLPITADATPPEPNVMTWANGGEPNAISNTQIRMTATTAIDATTPPTEYYFTNVTDSNHNSGWQSDTVWTDTALASGTLYKYNVRARDSRAPVPNETAKSTPDANATTHAVADTTCPDPNPATWATRPTTVSDSQITMTATTATDLQGVQYFFTNKTDSNKNSGWQDSSTFLNIGLTPNHNYIYTVKAKDKALVPNVTAESNEANAMTTADTTCPDPNPATFGTAPYATGTTSIKMKATIATDATGVWYQFRSSAGDYTVLRAWSTDANFENTGLTQNTKYGYQVRAGDAVTGGNMTAWSTAAEATTARTIQSQIDEAIANRASGYPPVTVTITEGNYPESINIKEPNITLKSASGAAATIIAPGASYQQAVEVNAANDVTIDGFTIKQGTQTFSAANPQQHTIWVHADRCTIQNCKIIGAGGNQAGIFIGGRQASVPTGGGDTAIWGYNIPTSKGHQILNNTFRYGTGTAGSGEGWGIFAVKLSDDSLISGNTFNGDVNDINAFNTDEGAPGTCIMLHSAAKGSGTRAVTIQNNNAQYVKFTFLNIYAAYPFNESATDTDPGKLYEQPEDSDVNDVLVTGNTAHDLGQDPVRTNGAAITFQGKHTHSVYTLGSADVNILAGKVTIQSNTFYNTKYGVYIKAPSVYAADSNGCVHDANNILIGTNNSFYNIPSNGFGVYNGTHDTGQDPYHGYTAVDVNAVGNWWGANSGPYNATTHPLGYGVPVDANVIYSTYLTSAP
jgi:hypothetical protein